MEGPPAPFAGRLPRLAPESYRGYAFVHWTMTIDHRARGWLDPLHHARLRELLCHALSHHELVCAVYCLMPDHGHFLLCGTSPASDQRLAVRAFRQSWNRLLAPDRQLQTQAYDHVLREAERAHGAFQAIAQYILENPVRATLAANWWSWPHSGAMVPGYPELDPIMEGYWEHFWRVWNHLVAKSTKPDVLANVATPEDPAPPS